MKFDWLQTGSVWAGIAALVLALGGAGASGVIALRDQSRKSTGKFIRRLERALEDADARAAAARKESEARERELLERIDDLEQNVRRHHRVIHDGRCELSALMLQPGLSDYIVGLMSKIHDTLDTRR